MVLRTPRQRACEHHARAEIVGDCRDIWIRELCPQRRAAWPAHLQQSAPRADLCRGGAGPRRRAGPCASVARRACASVADACHAAARHRSDLRPGVRERAERSPGHEASPARSQPGAVRCAAGRLGWLEGRCRPGGGVRLLPMDARTRVRGGGEGAGIHGAHRGGVGPGACRIDLSRGEAVRPLSVAHRAHQQHRRRRPVGGADNSRPGAIVRREHAAAAIRRGRDARGRCRRRLVPHLEALSAPRSAPGRQPGRRGAEKFRPISAAAERRLAASSFWTAVLRNLNVDLPTQL